MKKILSLALVSILLLGLVACGGESDGNKKTEGSFQVGFGRADFTPTDTVHMGSYNNEETSLGVMHPLYAHAVVMTDAAGTTMVIVTTDMSWGSNTMVNDLRPMIEEKFGIDKAHVVIGGIHNHNAPYYSATDTYSQQWKELFRQSVLDAIQQGMDDRAPATIEIGRTETEALTFVRRYYLADGGMTGDNYNYDHNSTITAHESEADEEIQMVRFVREGDKKDVLIVNWQSHAAKHGHTRYLSADFAGPMRDKLDEELNVHSVFYQGACGNLNPVSRISGECVTGGTGYDNAVKHGELVAQYVIDAWKAEGVFSQVESGNINVNQGKFLTDETWAETNTITVGDLSFVTLPAEFFDTLGMTIKKDTPYKMTLLVGYTCGGDGRYLPDTSGFENGGYEANNSLFRVGDGERFVQYYLDILNDMYKAENP